MEEGGKQPISFRPSSSAVDYVAGTLFLAVAFLFHWVGQTVSLINLDLAIKLGIQEDDIPPEFRAYELGIAVGDCALGWTYAFAGVGVLMKKQWGYRMAWFPSVILLYHSLCVIEWTAGWIRLGYDDLPLAQPSVRYSWFAANLACAVVGLYVAWTHQPRETSLRQIFPGANVLAGVLLLLVGFLCHWVASLISLSSWDLAVRLGFQMSNLTTEMQVYVRAFAVADSLIGWIYGLSGIGMLWNKAWGYQTAWFGLILVYYAINFLAWTHLRMNLGYHMTVDEPPIRFTWFFANLVTGVLAVAVAWDYWSRSIHRGRSGWERIPDT